MPACATQKKVTDSSLSGNLLLPVPDTDFRDYLDEVDELIQFAPQIIVAIEKDLDTNAREKKLLRMEDRKFNESSTDDLPQLDIAERNLLADELGLAVGSSIAATKFGFALSMTDDSGLNQVIARQVVAAMEETTNSYALSYLDPIRKAADCPENPHQKVEGNQH